MALAAALIYWVIIALWLLILSTLSIAFIRNRETFGTIRLLLLVLAIDTLRNVAENVYFGLYFGGQYGFFPAALVAVLGDPNFLIIPKIMNVLAACAVLSLLVLRWLPLASAERRTAEMNIRFKENELNKETEENRRLFDTSLDLILVTDRSGVFARVSPSSFSIIGYMPEEMIGRSAEEFIHSSDLASTRQEMRTARKGGQTRNFETRYAHKEGRFVPLAWSGVWSEPEQKHFFFGRDMTEQKAAAEKLRDLAMIDQLTGLPNRSSLHESLAQHLATRTHPISLVIVGLDGFKDINDTLGPSIGDKLLKAAADRISEGLPEQTYRLGGDEFVLLLAGCGDPIRAAEAVSKAIQDIGVPFKIEEHTIFVTASAGIAIASSQVSCTDDLLSSAGLALYDAKASGGAAYRLFVPSLKAKASARRELSTELRRAFSQKEFVLYFQPQVRVNDGMICGAEALIRWRHPDRGILAPSAFIEALSESAVVLETGRWILTDACRLAASWRAKGLPKLKIGVNLFPAQFRQGTLLSDVEYALSKTGLPADALELEITENIALSNNEAMLEPLRALREKGVGIAFDDFGTGYASLSYLTRYPLTRIKIDRSFVQEITKQSSPENTAIVRSILTMARNLKLQVTAEGVETLAQLEFLREKRCDELQGYYFSKPLPAAEFESLLRSNKCWSDLHKPEVSVLSNPTPVTGSVILYRGTA